MQEPSSSSSSDIAATNGRPRTVAVALLESLHAAGITHAFAVPGESYLAVLDAALEVPIRIVTCRHEASAAHMAEASAKLTGRPALCMVTRGPGATHAAIGVHTAQQDSTPMVLLVGQVGTDALGREAFQEIDYHAMFGTIAKRVTVLDQAARVPEQVAAAVHAATSGRPGPVVLVLPEDVLHHPCDAPTAAPTPPYQPAPAPAAVTEIAHRLQAAQNPLLLLGGPGWTETDVARAVHLAEAHGLPAVTSWRRKDRFPNHHAHYAGELGLGANPALVARVRAADLVLAIGARLGENPTQGYTLFAPGAAPQLIHLHPDAAALNRVWQPALAVHAGIAESLAALATLAPTATPARAAAVAAARAEYEAFTAPTAVRSGPNPAEIVAHLSAAAPDAVFANGAGNFAAWLHRFHHHRRLGTQLAPTSGAMGYGLPAGIAAAVHGHRAIVFAGDGDLQMSIADLVTATHEDVPLAVVVLDNAQYGTIRMHQARDFPGRQSATRLTNPDFAALARACGFHAERVERTQDFAPAWERAAAHPRSLIHVLTDPQEISPGRRLEDGA